MVGAPGRFVGLDNYLSLLRDEVFLRTAWNSVVYTAVAVGLKFVLGLTMALILDQPRRFNNVFRTLLFVPWAVPVVIVALNWRWIFDDLSGFLNNFLITFHITSDIISWLADPQLAMACVIAVVVWAIAGLDTASQPERCSCCCSAIRRASTPGPTRPRPTSSPWAIPRRRMPLIPV